MRTFDIDAWLDRLDVSVAAIEAERDEAREIARELAAALKAAEHYLTGKGSVFTYWESWSRIRPGVRRWLEG